MTKDKVRKLRESLQAVLDMNPIEGYCLQVGNASYAGGIVTFKVECAAVDANGQVANREADAFRQYARFAGLRPDDLGRRFLWQGKTFEIAGYNVRAPKMPVLAKNVETDKLFKFRVEDIKRLLES